MLLPPAFWVPHGEPAWRGGVERALMSTTADKAVALHYANGRGTVVEIDVGRIQIGGDVSFLSMVCTALSPPCPPCALTTVCPAKEGQGCKRDATSFAASAPLPPRTNHTSPMETLPPCLPPACQPRGARAGSRVVCAGCERGACARGAVSGGEGDHVSALHVPRVGRRRAPGARCPWGRGHHLPPQGISPSAIPSRRAWPPLHVPVQLLLGCCGYPCCCLSDGGLPGICSCCCRATRRSQCLP